MRCIGQDQKVAWHGLSIVGQGCDERKARESGRGHIMGGLEWPNKEAIIILKFHLTPWLRFSLPQLLLFRNANPNCLHIKITTQRLRLEDAIHTK
jgi:hypothetical protein